MSIELAGFVRTTLPLDLAHVRELDDGRYGALWMSDHLVSFWPDAIWHPEFTDLAEVSHSPHRYLDALALAGAVAASTSRVRIATSVIDTVRRHPVMIAQSAVTLSHLAQGRFTLGLGGGEKANLEPYGFEHERTVSRFEEALRVIRALWAADGPIDFEGRFFRLTGARLDAELHDGTPRRSGSVPAGLACWPSPGSTPTAGGRRAATGRRSTRPSSPSSTGRRRTPGATPPRSCRGRWSCASSVSRTSCARCSGSRW